jgi:transposase
VPALPSWLITPLWDQFCALLPEQGTYHPNHPLGCHRRRIADRVIFDKLIQVLVFGCGYRKIADATCSATTIRDRRDQWITAGIFATLEVLVALAHAIITLRRLIRCAWTLYRWDARTTRRP